MKEVRGLSNAEVKKMLESIAWRKAQEKFYSDIIISSFFR